LAVSFVGNGPLVQREFLIFCHLPPLPPLPQMFLQYSSLTSNSENGKTGSITVSTTSRHSCAPGCAFNDGEGCYAEAGYFTRLYWDKVTDGRVGFPPEVFIGHVKQLHCNEMFRHNIGGDLWVLEEDPESIDFGLATDLAKAASHLYAAWTYTHHTLTPGKEYIPGNWNRDIILKINREYNFTINISTESKDVASKLHKEGFMVTIVQPEGCPTAFRHEGVSFVQCPASLPGSSITCKTCGGKKGKPLCARKDRNCVVVFPTHGGRKVKAAKHCS